MMTSAIQQAVVCTILAILFLALSVFFLIDLYRNHPDGWKRQAYRLWITAALSAFILCLIWYGYSLGWLGG